MGLSRANKIVHGLWIGNSLSPLELLTLKSFIHFGHEFHLWVYNELENEIPKGVVVQDANQIIPESDIFVRNFDDPTLGIGKGSVGAPFSDIFRYKLLFERGGWWVDMDVTCLKPLDFEEDFIFRSHSFLPMIGNVMKVPKNTVVMKESYEKAIRLCTADTLDWLLPNKILNDQIERNNLQSHIKNNISNKDRWEETKKYAYRDEAIPKDWFIIHWMNEEWRSQSLPKNICDKKSALGRLYQKYHLQVEWGNPLKPSLEGSFNHYKYLYKKWHIKGKNWLKNPGIPVFIKSALKKNNANE